jgi:hypothetical protein
MISTLPQNSAKLQYHWQCQLGIQKDIQMDLSALPGLTGGLVIMLQAKCMQLRQND